MEDVPFDPYTRVKIDYSRQNHFLNHRSYSLTMLTPDQKIPHFSINIPNTLTILRILLAPAFVIILLRHQYLYALLIFAAAGVSDGLDGFIAKHYNQRTILGAFLDPIADKVLILSAYICLASLQIVPIWIAVIVISRDVIIGIGVAIFGIFNVRLQVNPSLISKFTTCLQIATVILVLIDPDPRAMAIAKAVLYWATAGFTVASGLHYIYAGVNMLQDALGHEDPD